MADPVWLRSEAPCEVKALAQTLLKLPRRSGIDRSHLAVEDLGKRLAGGHSETQGTGQA